MRCIYSRQTNGKAVSTEPKVLLIDLETAPNLGYVWGMYEQNVIDLKQGWYILCFSYRWLHEKKTHTVSLRDFKRYKRDKEDDRELCKSLWKLFDEASLIIAHNIRFDVKKSYARFIKHGLPPPSPSQYYCTLAAARKHFAFSSNRLNDLARYLLGARKHPHSGWDTWRRVLTGCEKAWRVLTKYNAKDVDLLHKLYLKLRGWGVHPRLVLPHQETFCPTCTSDRTVKRGVKHFRKHTKQQRKCLDCESWFLAEPIK